MHSLEARRSNKNGKLIALEGNNDIISVHLRLLPPSQKILVLPALQESISKATGQSPFEPKLFIRNVHATFIQRLKAAQSFLQKSVSTDNPRLVFMNGGTVRARAICIEGIYQNLTLGDIGAAEKIFNEIVKDGVAGLLSPGEGRPGNGVTDVKLEPNHGANLKAERSTNDLSLKERKPKKKQHVSSGKKYVDENSSCPQPADTAALSDTNGREKSRELPKPPNMKDHSSARMLVDSQESKINRHTSKHSLLRSQNEKSFSKKRTPSIKSERITRATHNSSSKEVINSRRRTIEIVPGCPFPVPFLPSIPAGKTQDAENDSDSSNELEFFTNDLSAPLITSFTSNKNLDKQPQLSRELKKSKIEVSPCESGRNSLYNLSKPTMTEELSQSSLKLDSERRLHIDKSCDADEPTGGVHEPSNELSLPMFELVEDLIINFADSGTDMILDTVFHSFQESRHLTIRPSSRPASSVSSNYQNNVPSSPESGPARDKKLSVGRDSKIYHKRTSFNPENSLGNFHSTNKITSPTPLMTPSVNGSSGEKISKRIINFSATNSSNAISVHNSFRRLLSSHLPAGKNRHSQYYHSTSVEADRLWKPVFGNWNISECVLKKTDVDQIIALGSETSVDSEFMCRISGMIEQVGSKRNGISRSGKLNIGYLISNALLNFNDASLDQHITNPLSNPLLIANLIIPQLESYFASNSSTQLLVLQFPSSYISIVFALQELIGSTLFKIAGIVSTPSYNTTKSPPSPVSPNSVSSMATGSYNDNSTQYMGSESRYTRKFSSVLNSVPQSPSIVSAAGTEREFFGVDYVLSCTAVDEEIVRFISGIRQSLLEISSFYMPEPEPEPRTIIQVVEKYLPAPSSNFPVPNRPSSQQRSSLIDTYAAQDGSHRPSSRRQSSRTGRQSISTALHNPLSDFIAKRNYATSIASSRRTIVSNMSADLDGWENFEIGDEDSDFDDYDRMILGSKMAGLILGRQMFGAGSDENKIAQHGMASKRKALKWLGLA